MNSFYFIIAIYKRKVLQAIVEMEELQRVANFLTAVEDEKMACESHYEAEVMIFKAFVSDSSRVMDKPMENDLLLKHFYTNDLDKTKRLALGTK